jgi:hypothetical protein
MSLHERAEGAAGTFQRGKLSNPHSDPKTKAPLQACRNTQLRSKTHSAQQAWMNSRNPSTIASGSKHRQPVFLHPTEDGTSELGLFQRGKQNAMDALKTGPSLRSGSRLRAHAHKDLDLLILPPASTLQVFHFMIGRFRILI